MQMTSLSSLLAKAKGRHFPKDTHNFIYSEIEKCQVLSIYSNLFKNKDLCLLRLRKKALCCSEEGLFIT
jgi:hypothetical protein